MKHIAMLAALFLFVGCLPESVTAPFKEYQSVIDTLKENAQLEAAISFNMKNGRYTSYVVTIQDNPDGLTHEEITEEVEKAILQENSAKPKTVLIAYPVMINDEK